MAFNPNEPRDAHGHWVKGAGSALKALEAVIKGHGEDSSSPVSKGDARLAEKAYQRHIEQGRSFPGKTTSYEDTLKNLDAVAKGIREDAVKWNKKDPKIAQQLRKQARAIEKVQKVHTGQVDKPLPTDKPTVGAAQPKWTKVESGFYSLEGTRYAVARSFGQSKSEDANKPDFTTKPEWAAVRFKEGEKHTTQGGENLDWFDTMEQAKAFALQQSDAKPSAKVLDKPVGSDTTSGPALSWGVTTDDNGNAVHLGMIGEAPRFRIVVNDGYKFDPTLKTYTVWDDFNNKKLGTAISSLGEAKKRAQEEVNKDLTGNTKDIRAAIDQVLGAAYTGNKWPSKYFDRAVNHWRQGHDGELPDLQSIDGVVAMLKNWKAKPGIDAAFASWNENKLRTALDHIGLPEKPVVHSDLPPVPDSVKLKDGIIAKVGDTVIAKGVPQKIIDLDARKQADGSVRNVVVTPGGKYWADTVRSPGEPQYHVPGGKPLAITGRETHVEEIQYKGHTLRVSRRRHFEDTKGATPENLWTVTSGDLILALQAKNRDQAIKNAKTWIDGDLQQGDLTLRRVGVAGDTGSWRAYRGNERTPWHITEQKNGKWRVHFEETPGEYEHVGVFASREAAFAAVVATDPEKLHVSGKDVGTDAKGEPPYTLKAQGGAFHVFKGGQVVQTFDDRGKARRWARAQNRKAGFGPAKGKGGGGGSKSKIEKGSWVVNKDGRRGEVMSVVSPKADLKLPPPESLINPEELLSEVQNPYHHSGSDYKSSWEQGFTAGANGKSYPPAAPGQIQYAAANGIKAGEKARKTELAKIKREQAQQKREARGGFEVRYNTGQIVREIPRNVKTTEPPVSIYRHQGDVPGQAAGLFEALKAGVEADETDWSRLDPAKRSDLPEGHVIGHAQELLFDLARGSDRKRVVDVKSNQDIKKDLEAEGVLAKLTQQAEKKTPYSFKIAHNFVSYFEGTHGNLTIKPGRGKYSKGTATFAGEPSAADLRALGVLNHLGTNSSVRVKDPNSPNGVGWYYAHQFTHSGDPLEAAKKIDLAPGSEETYTARLKMDRAAEVKKAVDRAVAKEITKRRRAEGTSNMAFSIPHWEDVKMVDQNWNDVKEQMAKASKGSYVPVFHTSGKVEEGVVYHRGGHGGSRGTEVKVGRVFYLEHLGYYRVTKIDGTKIESERLSPAGVVMGTAGPDAGKFNLPTFLEGATHYWDKVPEGGGRMLTTPVPEHLLSSLGDGDINGTPVEKPVAATDAVVSSRSLFEADKSISDAMQKSGAKMVENSKNIDPGYRGRGKIYAGQMWLLELEKGQPVNDMTAFANVRSDPIFTETANIGSAPTEQLRVRFLADVANQTSLTQGKTRDILTKRQRELDDVLKTQEAAFTKEGSTMGLNQVKRQREALAERAKEMQAVIDRHYTATSPGKRVEYVPHEQPKLGAPTSQRGRITVHGLTPEEATAKLQELGIVGDVETQVPFESIMRSGRRDGLVLPLHRDYLTGDAPPPELLHLITHGLTGRNTEEAVLRGGGLHSIAERYRRGIHVQSTSPSGDIRSGLDHTIFGAHDSGSTCGSSSPVRIAYKPEAMLRRNILMAPRDYGGMDTRYEHYKTYLNGLQRRAGEPTTSLYQPVSPKTRQSHISKRKRPGSAEFNIAGSVPVEDMAVIGVQTQAMADKINKILEEEMAAGRITSRPDVVIGATEFRNRVEA